jgi:hypothetical protein
MRFFKDAALGVCRMRKPPGLSKLRTNASTRIGDVCKCSRTSAITATSTDGILIQRSVYYIVDSRSITRRATSTA